MTEDEAAAIAIAFALRQAGGDGDAGERAPSRWKVADRKPDLEIEELRAIY